MLAFKKMDNCSILCADIQFAPDAPVDINTEKDINVKPFPYLRSAAFLFGTGFQKEDEDGSDNQQASTHTTGERTLRKISSEKLMRS